MDHLFTKQILIQAPNETLTGHELKARISGLSETFQRYGVGKQELIGIQMEPGIDYVLAVFALANIGAIPVLIPTRLNDVQIQSILSDNQITTTVSHIPPYTTSSKALTDFSHNDIIVLTSGSSTKPKLAVLTFDNFIQNAVGANQNIPFEPGDKWLLNLPMYHVGGLSIFFRALIGGGCAAFTDLNDTSLTHVSMVHTQLFRFTQHATVNKFKSILLGGSAFPDSLIAAAKNLGLPLYRSYGMTEMASQITTTQKGSDLKTSGKILAGRELKIENGEIFVRGTTLFSGFLYQVGSPFTDDGWYATHDLGKWNENHELIVTGRKDRMFICGGENIQPEAIEEALLNIPGVRQARVTALPDDEYGHVPVAYVDAPGTRGIVENLKETLSGLQIPRKFLPFSELPNPSLKDLI